MWEENFRFSVKASTPVCAKFSQILTVETNKTELFTLIVNEMVETYGYKLQIQNLFQQDQKKVVANQQLIENQNLMSCLEEKTDDRMFIHVNSLNRDVI